MSENRKEDKIPSIVRCAIYTRKSTDENLDSDFNSLDAQRESAENFIRSQALEGWMALPDRYDDGAYSGATLERPALKKLMDDVEQGKIDAIVIYKLDRLCILTPLLCFYIGAIPTSGYPSQSGRFSAS